MTEVNIEPKSKLNYPKFSELKRGDWFDHAGYIYIKVNNDIILNCLLLSGYLCSVDLNVDVKLIDKVNIELTYKEQS